MAVPHRSSVLNSNIERSYVIERAGESLEDAMISDPTLESAKEQAFERNPKA